MIRRRRAGYLSVLFYIVNIISDVKLYLKKCTELLLKKKKQNLPTEGVLKPKSFLSILTEIDIWMDY